MILGRQLIEKMYSESQVEERIYSTGNDDLDDLLERAFCDGYEFAQREFGFKERRELNKSMKDAGINRRERKEINKLNNLSDDEKDRRSELISEDRETRDERNKRNQKKLITEMAGGAGLMGGAIGNQYGRFNAGMEGIADSGKHLQALFDGKTIEELGALANESAKKANKTVRRGTALGAAAGIAAGAGLSHAIKKRNDATSKRAEENPEGTEAKMYEKERDKMKVARGEMSASEYAEKWNKKKK